MNRRWVQSTLLVLLMFATLAPCPGRAATWNVPSQVATVAAALDSAAAGDTVLVACGTWRVANLEIPSGVTLRGDGSPTCVVLDGGGADRVLNCAGVSGVRIESLTVASAVAPGDSTDSWRTGGGLRCESAEVVVADCVFRLNWAQYGAGVGARASTLTLERTLFTGNTSWAVPWSAGGGVYAQDSQLTVSHCTFSANTATSVSVPADGGGMFLDGCRGEIADCGFSGNTALAGAGGVYSFRRDETTIRRTTFTGNSAAAGGAMYFEMSRANLVDCLFAENSAANGGAVFFGEFSINVFTGCDFSDNTADPYSGGAADSWQSTTEYRDCRFTGNTSVLFGGALSLHTLAVGKLQDCLVASNSTGGSGGALQMDDNGWAEIRGCTVVDNSAPDAAIALEDLAHLDSHASLIALQASGASVSCGSIVTWANLSCTDVWGNPGGDYVDCFAGKEGVDGNISQDPLFCDPLGGVWTLALPGSPALAENSPCGERIGSEPAGCGCPPGATALVPADFPTIAAALAAASPGDVIGVCDGTWEESLDLVPGVTLVGVRADLAHVVAPVGSDAVLRAVGIVEPTVVTGLTLEARGAASWVVRADSGSVGLHLRSNVIRGGATGGILNGPDSWVTIGGELAWANDILENGMPVPLPVRNLNAAVDSLPATLNWWGGVPYDQLVASLEGPVRTCPVTNPAHTDSLCAPLTAVGIPEPIRPPGLRLAVAPNPFRDEATVLVTGVEGSDLRLSVHDVLGRRVRLLAAGALPAGPIRWSGRDESGRRAAPGVYFVRAEVSGRVIVRKIVRIR